MDSLFKETRNTLEVLEKGDLILYPTDTIWGIGCDATNPEAVKKVYALKKRAEAQALICLVSDINMLKDYVEDIPDAAMDVIAFAEKPTTIIYDDPVNLAENLIAPDGSVGIRIIYDQFCRHIIKKFGKPLVATSANISGQPAPGSFKKISSEIIEGVGYIVDMNRDKECTESSSIVKIDKDGLAQVIRE